MVKEKGRERMNHITLTFSIYANLALNRPYANRAAAN